MFNELIFVFSLKSGPRALKRIKIKKNFRTFKFSSIIIYPRKWPSLQQLGYRNHDYLFVYICVFVYKSNLKNKNLRAENETFKKSATCACTQDYALLWDDNNRSFVKSNRVKSYAFDRFSIGNSFYTYSVTILKV